VAGGHRWQLVRAGLMHTCGITTAGKAYCWGNSEFGQVGNASRQTQLTPAAVSGNHTWRWINPGGTPHLRDHHRLARLLLGRNGEGELGGGTTRSSIGTPVVVSGGLAFKNISAGHFHTCAVTTADRAYCWGSNSSGTLGDGGQATRSQPRPVAGTRRYHNTSASQFYSCALTLAGKGECWGSNPRGELGSGTTTSTTTPASSPAI
jgi:alpha-tubulin suppressor-like RCC1 family protein